MLPPFLKMWKEIITLIVFSFLNIYVTNAKNNSMSPSHRSQLLHDLFSLTKYDSAAIPDRSISEPITIDVDIYFMDIVLLDLQNEVLTTKAMLTQYWKDELLTWNPDEYGGVKFFYIPVNRIWNPDLVLLNEAGQRKNDEFLPDARVSYTGQVTYEPIVHLESECAVDATYFPFDHHTCPFQFYTKLYSDTLHLDLAAENERDSVLNMLALFRPGEFIIYNAHINSSCNASEQGHITAYHSTNGTILSYCFIEAQISLLRRPLHYMHITVYPVIVVSLLSLLVFRLTPASGERISFCITLALVYQILLMTVGDKMPQDADSAPLISIYLSVELLMSSVGLLVSIIVINMYEKGPGKQVPDWMRWLFLDKLAWVFCFERAHRFAKKNQPKTKESENEYEQSEMIIKGPKDEQEKDEDEIVEEWRAVSFVLDKLFFWVFLIITFVMGICMAFAVFVHYEGKPKEIVAKLIEEGALRSFK